MSDKLAPTFGKRYVVTPAADGSVVIEQTTWEHRWKLGPALVINGPLWVLFGYVGVQYYQIMDGKLSPFSDPMVFIGVGLLLIALCQFVDLVSTLFDREQWLVRPNELRRRRSIFGRTRETSFRDGKFFLRRVQGSTTPINHYWLYCRVPGRWFRIKVDDTIRLGYLEEFADFISTHLGGARRTPGSKRFCHRRSA
jgi:hypothetical protein